MTILIELRGFHVGYVCLISEAHDADTESTQANRIPVQISQRAMKHPILTVQRSPTKMTILSQALPAILSVRIPLTRRAFPTPSLHNP